MRTIKPILYILLLTFSVSHQLKAQNYFFAEAKGNELPARTSGARMALPMQYRSVDLDTFGIHTFLKKVGDFNLARAGKSNVIELPTPMGGKARFAIWESPVMDPVLAAHFPEIKTYAGQGVDDPSATIKLDYTPLGFHAMILSDLNGDMFIDPYQQLDLRNYIVYYKRDFRSSRVFIEQEVPGLFDKKVKTLGNRPMAGPCVGTQLRSYRLAIACTGEYARAATSKNSPTVAEALAAIVTTINRVDGIYEKEVAISLNLVANNNQVVFVDPNTDPFTANNDGSALLDESQTVIDANIGAGNYDIGHTFSTGAGGIAQIGSVCSGAKARGVTGSPSPVGDPFDIDYVAHEMGHQFDASHSFNAATGSCSGNRNDATAVEPGSGITIMSYAGICGSNDLGNNSLPYFHGVSMDEINNFVTTGNGATCGTVSATGNIVPIVNAGNNYTIPKSTPFVLTGTATDGNDAILTYSWEEEDTGPAGNWNSPSGNAPIFRSFAPVAAPVRYFPKLSDQVNNITSIGEILPSYARTMNFRLTARDNRSGGGGVCYDETTITVANSGPFVVTVPSATGITWSGSSTQTVTWNVNGTSGAPVNCANVTIQLSTDGGLTFPITILASTPNDGTEQITVPDNPTNKARIRVMALGNVFYDMSNNNFTITTPIAGFDFTTPEAAKVPCADPGSTSITLGIVPVLGFSNPVTLSATGNPPGTTVSFSSTTVTPGSNVQVTLNNTDLLPFDSSYVITVTGTSGSIVKSQQLTYTIQTGTGPAIMQQPIALQICRGANGTFSVASPNAVAEYQWQVSSNGGQSYTNIAGSNGPLYTVANADESQNNYLYRVLLRGQCNVSTSNPVALTVYKLPEVTLATTSTSIVPGETSLLTATVVAGSGNIVTAYWIKDGDTIPVTGNNINVDVSGLGEYQVLVSDNAGCVNQSETILISGRASDRLFIYPNPNDGQFKLSYFNAGGGSARQSVTIYDAKGARIYFKQFAFSGFYGLLDIDLRGRPRGVYLVVIGDANGRKLADGKILVSR